MQIVLKESRTEYRGVRMKRRLVSWLMPSVVIFVTLGGWPQEGFASEAIDFRQLERDVVDELNNARTNPRSYAAHLKEMSGHFHGKELRFPGRTPLITKEGVAAVTEGVRFLEKAKPLPSLKRSQGMSRGARDHVEVLGTGDV